MVNRPPALKRESNVDFLNTYREEMASPMFQARVPNFTKANLQDQWQRLSEIPELRNEFVSALVNRLGRVEIKSLAFENPLEIFKRESMLYGSIIEEVQTGVLKAKTYDPTRSGSEENLFAREYPEVQSSFHTVSRRDMYKNTIDENELRRAFLSEEGLSPFVTQLMNMANESDKIDEFTIMSNLLVDMHKAGGYHKVQIPDIRAVSAGTEDAKAALKAIRTIADTLPYPSRRFNSAGMMVSAKRDELVLFLTPEANATLDVDGLAALFNVERGEVPFRTIVIPFEFWPIKGAQAVLTTATFFVVADTFYQVAMQPNAAGRYTNYFLHHDQIVSLSRFAPAVLFTTEAGTPYEWIEAEVASVTPIVVLNPDTMTEVTTLARGGVYTFNDGEAVTDPAGMFNDAVRYEILDANSSRTRLWQTRTLVIGRDEAAETIRIRKFATDDNTVYVERTYTLTEHIIDEFPPGVIPDADRDGIEETDQPEAPAFAANKITIPNVRGVQYRDGATNLTNGQEITITANKTITAVARTGLELPTGATTSWTFTYTA